jgi:hypothetical protein
MTARTTPLALLLGLGGCAMEAIPLAQPKAPGVKAGGTADAGAHVPDAAVGSSADVFLVAGTSFGLVLLDLSNPTAPIEVSATGAGGEDDEPRPLYALTANDSGQVFAGRAGSIDVYALDRGRLVPGRAISIGEAHAFGVQADGARLYAALGTDGVAIFDVSGDARRVGTLSTQRGIFDVRVIDGDHIAVYDGHDPALWIYDVRDPARPALVSNTITDFIGSRSSGMAASGGFVATNVTSFGSSALWFWDVRDPGQPTSLGFHPDVRAPRGGGVALWSSGVVVFGYFADPEEGLVIAEASLNRRHPRSGRLSEPSLDVAIHANTLYVAHASDSVRVYEILADRPEAPQRVRTVTPLAIGAERITVVRDRQR